LTNTRPARSPQWHHRAPERTASCQPVVLCIDDGHWADPDVVVPRYLPIGVVSLYSSSHSRCDMIDDCGARPA
jgi:hypothetical protein